MDAVDATLARLGVSLVLLDVPDALLAERSFHRPEMASQGWEPGLVSWYGSRDGALEAFRSSQQRRRDALARTRLPTLHLDTSDRQ